MKQILKILKKIFIVLIIVIAVMMFLFTIVSLTGVDSKNRNLFGYKAFIVLTDSMSATDFNAGDLVIVKQTPSSDLKEGDIISYRLLNDNNDYEVVTHKIRKIDRDSRAGLIFTTYGTTTGVDDDMVVLEENVLGRYCFSIPKLGSFFQYLKTSPGYILFILIPFLILMFIQAVNSIRLFNLYKKETLDDINEERKRFEQEKIESDLIKTKLQEAEENALKMKMEIEELKNILKKQSDDKKSISKRKSKTKESNVKENTTKNASTKKQTDAKKATTKKQTNTKKTTAKKKIDTRKTNNKKKV